MSVSETRRVLKISRHPISLDRPVGESEDSYFGDFIEDESAESPVSAATQEMLKEKTISQDDERRSLDEIQKLTDRYSAEIDQQLAAKEKEILQV